MKISYLSRYIVCLLILAVFSAPASGQIYKYVDKDGVVRYVDELSKVPEEYRPEAEKYEELESPDTGTVEIRTPPSIKQPNQTPKPKSQSEPKQQSGLTKKEIEKRKQELDEEYKALMAEKEQIEKDIETYSKRYNTRRRKSVSRKKLKELEIQKSKWEEKFTEYNAKRIALELLEQQNKTQ